MQPSLPPKSSPSNLALVEKKTHDDFVKEVNDRLTDLDNKLADVREKVIDTAERCSNGNIKTQEALAELKAEVQRKASRSEHLKRAGSLLGGVLIALVPAQSEQVGKLLEMLLGFL